jgi:hypothetical protein
MQLSGDLHVLLFRTKKVDGVQTTIIMSKIKNWRGKKTELIGRSPLRRQWSALKCGTT